MNLPLNTEADIADPLAQARFNMVEQQIRPWHVSDPRILDLLAEVRREDFVPAEHAAQAFMDLEIPLPGGQCMLAPKVEARFLQDLQIQPHERVLEIGAGSGHMAALLSRLAASVVSVDIRPELVRMAQANLRKAGIANVQVLQADGAVGAISGGPFDVIVVSGSVARVPQNLLDQLKDGGRLEAVVGDEPMMRATVVRRTGSSFVVSEPWDIVVPRLEHFPEPSHFSF
ncbi:protein-L-isoaspartate O-methyltransferase [Ramlibacter sp. H39-3-26]|uniref:protein-L-isoaspartate O-methyltransferase family protein n=1 Tax=Curvibacter soli TaxID=3031331 RepID=UPI0023DA5395|nr:protein-L-isoaspartate O-methyltransferase [Ramlibacter sp. H39-3-26]MDF1485718.1 protein-L-isoaspartate O-methyltransferase [Ramlibacter sp. H39-3-26]